MVPVPVLRKYAGQAQIREKRPVLRVKTATAHRCEFPRAEHSLCPPRRGMTLHLAPRTFTLTVPLPHALDCAESGMHAAVALRDRASRYLHKLNTSRRRRAAADVAVGLLR